MRVSFFFLLFFTLLQHSHVLAYKTIIDILSKERRFETLIHHLQRNRLVPILNQLDAGTLFAPDNDAFANYHGPRITQDILLYHLVPSLVSTDHFYHHQILESSYKLEDYLQNNASQRLLVRRPADKNLVSKRPSIFINDAQLITTDMHVNANTTIHSINKVLELPDMLAPTLEPRNSDLYQLMAKVGLTHMINLHQPFTVFYSDQSILQPFNNVEKNYLLSKFGDEDLNCLLNYLIIRGDIYAEDFKGEKQYKTINGESLTIKVDKDHDVITVNGHPIIQKDILAANGVLHKVEIMPITNQLMFDTRKYLYGIDATKFVSLLDKYGLGYYLASGVTNFTVLAPDNDSIDEGAIPDNKKKAWLSYHLLHGQWYQDRLHDRQLLASEFSSPELNGMAQQIPVSMAQSRKSSIFFGKGRVRADPLTINDNVIYQLSNPMTLPYDVFSSIVIDLELSSFIATLYVSGVVDRIKSASAITLFAPTNQAYKSLGLVGTYLVHPTGRQDLQTTLQYHAAKALLYEKELRSSAYNVATLDGIDNLQVGGTDENGAIRIGDNGTVQQTNMLMANGVVHKMDTVMVPSSVTLTHRKILVGLDAHHRVLDWFDEFPWLNNDDGDYILLAPTDRAFTQLDEHLGSGWEQKDPEAYEQLVRLHVIPKAQQLQHRTLLGGEIEDYPTLLSDRDHVVVHDQGYFAEQFVQVMGKTGQGSHARILARGELRQYAHIIQLDTVLIPVSRGLFGLHGFWPVVLVISLAAVVGVAVLALAGYFIWQRCRRSGYESINDEEQEHPTATTSSHEPGDPNQNSSGFLSNGHSAVAQDSGVAPNGPGTTIQDSGVASNIPGTAIQDSGAASNIPGTAIQDSGVASNIPGTAIQDSGGLSSDHGAATQLPQNSPTI